MENGYDAQLDKAIEMGKTWMTESKDVSHNAIHAQNVENIAYKVLDEMISRGEHSFEDVNPKLVSIAAWWHDCYKATQGKFTLRAAVTEGKESEKIIREELSGILTDEDMEEVCSAVEGHAGWPLARYMIFNRYRSPLHLLLLEGDTHDLLSRNRVLVRPQAPRSLIDVPWVFLDLTLSLLVPFHIRTATTRKNLKRKLFDYWATWLWRDKVLWRMIVGPRGSDAVKMDTKEA